MNYKKLLIPNQSDLDSYSYTKKVGNYLIGSILGKGAFASVNEGMHTLTGEKVAVKIVDKLLCQKDNYVKKHLHREGKIMQKINHPNIVQLLEIMETGNSYYLAMELCSGNLMSKISTKTFLSESETRYYMRQLISAVDYLHKNNIMHRDLKVENILLTADDILKLTDFGISIQIIPSNLLNLSNMNSQEKILCKTQCGSPAYAAPEILSKSYYSFPADIWSIGVNMFAMLTGSLPFTVKPFSIQALRDKMIHKQMNPLPDSISTECRNLILKFLDPDSNMRISLSLAMIDPWICPENLPPLNSNQKSRIPSISFNSALLKYMEDNLNFTKSDVMKSLLENSPTSPCATYKLLIKKTTVNHPIEKLPSAHSLGKLLGKTDTPNSGISIKPVNTTDFKSETASKENKEKCKTITIPNSVPCLLSKNHDFTSQAVQGSANENTRLLYNRQKAIPNKLKTSLEIRYSKPATKPNLVQLMDGYNTSYFSNSNTICNQKPILPQWNTSLVNLKSDEYRRNSIIEEIWKIHRSKLQRKKSFESHDCNKYESIFKGC